MWVGCLNLLSCNLGAKRQATKNVGCWQRLLNFVRNLKTLIQQVFIFDLSTRTKFSRFSIGKYAFLPGKVETFVLFVQRVCRKRLQLIFNWCLLRRLITLGVWRLRKNPTLPSKKAHSMIVEHQNFGCVKKTNSVIICCTHKICTVTIKWLHIFIWTIISFDSRGVQQTLYINGLK